MILPGPLRALLAVLLLLGALAPAEARRGYARTRAGQVIEGHLRFESNAVILVDAARDLWTRVALTNLDAVGFDPEPGPEPAPAAAATGDPGRPGPLPWPWEAGDIGSAREPGGGECFGRTFRARSSGTNVLGDSDACHFVHKTVTGESEIIARLARVHCADPWATAGLMMRESLAADARHVFLALTPARGGQWVTRDRTRGETSVEILSGAQAPAWLKLRREGDLITAWRSRDGQRWTNVARFTGSWPEELLVGMAVTGGRLGQVSQALFEQVEEAPSVPNRAFVPQVELVSGSLQPGYIASLDETVLRFQGFLQQPVSTPRVARILFQPLPGRLAPRLASGRPGVLLASGEFIEGDCRRIERGRVTVNSIPLGVRRYDVNHEVIAVVLHRRPLLASRSYEVRTVDGATWLASEVVLDAGGLLLREPQLGPRRLAWHQVLELRRAT